MTKHPTLLVAVVVVSLVGIGGFTLGIGLAQSNQPKIALDFQGTGPDSTTLANPTVRFDNLTITAELLHIDRPPGVE